MGRYRLSWPDEITSVRTMQQQGGQGSGRTPVFDDRDLLTMKEALARNLREVRIAQGLRQDRLAAMIGVQRQDISQAERGAPDTSVDFLIKALLAAGLTPADVARMILEGE